VATTTSILTRIVNVIWISAISLTLAADADDKRTSTFAPDFLKTIVSMEQLESPTNAHSIGTGFVVGSPNGHILLITANHILEGVKASNGGSLAKLAWRLNETNGPSDLVYDQFVTQFLGGGWFMSSNADVACRFITYGNESDVRGLPVSMFLPQKQLEPGAPVLILGFPMGIRSEKYAKPIVRHGIVALSEHSELMLDAFVFPGNSGGPVFYAPSIMVSGTLQSPLVNEDKIIGMVTDYVPYTDVGISPQTHRPRITFEENSGLSHAVPADRIIELINRPDVVVEDMRLPKPPEAKK
jgi:hypothetical protein